MWYNLFSGAYNAAARKMCEDCKEFIKKGSRILDLGCGSAIASKAFKDYFQADVFGVDVVDRRVVSIPFRIIEGRLLPFADDSFDAVLIAYVLHHSEDPVFLLKEVKRVAKDKIFIYEDLSEGFISKLFCELHGLSFDSFFHNKNKTIFKTGKEWEEVFKELGLKLVFQKRVSSSLNPVEKKLFVLEKMRA